MLLWIISILYRYYCDAVQTPIPQPYAVIYQLIVTASTIGDHSFNSGYGDYTPKSKDQIIFFTLIIPLLCTSFVIYLNSLVNIYTNTFLEDKK
jgi:hypothetical protein